MIWKGQHSARCHANNILDSLVLGVSRFQVTQEKSERMSLDVDLMSMSKNVKKSKVVENIHINYSKAY